MGRYLAGRQRREEAVEISVIIPAHNAEKTLRRAVGSVCAALDGLKSMKAEDVPAAAVRHPAHEKNDSVPQKADSGQEKPHSVPVKLNSAPEKAEGKEPAPAPGYEVLVIENGSEDGTEFLARTLELERPEAVRFLRSEKGVSNARNRGLDEARGKWILFLDADDYFLPEAGAVLRDDLHFSGTDLIAHSYEAGKKTIHLCQAGGERYSGEYEEGLDGIVVRMIENPTRYTSVWSKLFRRERIEYGRLRFDPSLRLSEDSHFLIRYLSVCRRIRLFDRPFYHYSTDGASAVRSWDGKKEEGYRDSLIKVQSFLKTQPQPVREAFAGYGMMQFNLLMVREVFAAGSPGLMPQKIGRMKEISAQEPFAQAIREFDPARHRGARYLPIRLLKRGLFMGAAAVYAARAVQNARRERGK